MPRNPILQAALRYIEHGWNVLPLHGIRHDACTCGTPNCGDAGKHPLTRRGLLDASRESRQVFEWFEHRPWANLGIATGPSDLAVLDIDLRKNGLRSLERYGLDLRAAGKVQTGNGFHRYFQGPAPTSVGELGPGLDVRGIGGYVVAPPSRHLSGAVYVWLNLPSPLPKWPFPTKTTMNRDTPSLHGGIPEGTRNMTLFRIAGSLRRWDIPAPAIHRTLHAVNQEVCQPPLPHNEVEQLVAKILRRPTHGRLYEQAPQNDATAAATL